MSGRQSSVDSFFLAETLASRLCHDLSGEVHALAGAIEEMRDSAASDREAIELADDACEALIRRLRLARAAWGALGGPMAMDEWRALVDFMPRRGVTLALDDAIRAMVNFANGTCCRTRARSAVSTWYSAAMC